MDDISSSKFGQILSSKMPELWKPGRLKSSSIGSGADSGVGNDFLAQIKPFSSLGHVLVAAVLDVWPVFPPREAKALRTPADTSAAVICSRPWAEVAKVLVLQSGGAMFSFWFLIGAIHSERPTLPP